MSLKTTQYVIKEDYLNDTKSEDHITDFSKDLTEYFNLKQKYNDFLLKSQPSKKFITNINNSTGENKFITNYPIRFKEGTGKYIIEVFDDITKDVMYSKTININESLNVYDRIISIKNELSKQEVFINKKTVQNNINNIRKLASNNDLLYENKLISKQEFNVMKDKLKIDINNVEENYNRIRSEISDLNLELNMLNKIIKDFINTKFKLLNRLKIDNINIAWESYKMLNNKHSDNYLLEFHKLDRILYQEPTIHNGNLVYVNNQDDEDYIALIHKTSPDSDNIEIKDDDGVISNINKSEVKLINGIYNQLKNIKIDQDTCEISKEKYYDNLRKIGINRSISSNKIEIVNNVPGSKSTLQKKSINYGYSSKDKKKPAINLKKALKLQKKPQAENTFTDENKLYLDKGDIFMFYSKSSNKPRPGLGSKEIIKTDKKYDTLYVVAEWRKKLSNFWMCEKPINILGKEFISVEHFFHFMKFWEVNKFSGQKREQYNKYALNFTYNCPDPLCWGRSNGFIAKKKGGKLSGLNHRDDWFKTLEEILPEVDLDGYEKVLLRDYILSIGIYHKFTQNDELRELLISTKDALLIHPEGGSARSGVYLREYPIMFVRYLINSGNQINMKILSELLKKDYKVPEKSFDKTSSKSSNKSILSSLKESAESMGIDTTSLSPGTIEKRVEKKIVEQSIKDGLKLIEEIETLQKVLETNNKSIYEVPPNGDCGYHSIIEMMHIKNIFPVNFSGRQCVDDALCQYSSDTTLLNVSITDEQRTILILDEAMLQMRKDIGDKFKLNLTIDDSNDSEAIKIAKESIYTGYPSGDQFDNTNFNEKIRDDYYNKIILRHSNGGSWISELELQIAAALFNIDIIIYLSNNSKQIIRSSEMKAIFNKGKEYNIDKETVEIELGYYANYHYIGIQERVDIFKAARFNKLSYFIVPISDGDTIYEMVIDNSSDDIIPLGTFNVANNNIEYFTYSESSSDDKLVDIFDEKYDEIESNIMSLKQIHYYQNIEDNFIYITPSNDEESIGKLTNITDEEGEVHNKIIFN